jgi:phosphate transport system substrate-binding protein
MASAQALTGSGATFVAPLMSKWSRDYKKAKNIEIDYVAVGSGRGIQQFIEKETDFAFIDAPMKDEQLKAAKDKGGDVLHIPLVLGGVVAAYNLEGLKEPLRLTGPILAEIFMGKITKWNDAAIKELNPGVELPDVKIEVCQRVDVNRTTAMFTEFLAKISKDWKEQIGSGTQVRWPVGVSYQGTEGLAEAIAKTPGAIGYVDLLYALKYKMTVARIKNQDGVFVLPSLEGVTAAAEDALPDLPDDLRFSVTNVPGKDAYPISGATWVVVYAKQKGERGRHLVDFLSWATHDGQESLADLHYARLPKGLVKKVEKKLMQIDVAK